MTLNKKIKTSIEDWAGSKILIMNHLGGGSINSVAKIDFEKGNQYVLKWGGGLEDVYLKEANGLFELEKAGAIRIPRVYLADKDFLLMEFINPGKSSNPFFNIFGKKFALLHQHKGTKFGFKEDNQIGSTVQQNIANQKESHNWTEFYFQKRLLFQYLMAENNGYLSADLARGFRIIESKIDGILKGSEEPPCLIHGDLWSGNFLVDSTQSPCLIDPAVYYGHREADLAMTKLFGGFSESFYNAYNRNYPLKEGYKYRENIYLLYHVLNHLNIFGKSYHSQALGLMNSYR